MSRQAYMSDAMRIVAQVEAEARADMAALLAKHEQRLQTAISAIGASAQRNGVSARPQGFVLPNVRQVLSMARPSQVFNISY